MPNMTAVTVCFWSKVKQHASDLDAIFTYTSPFHLTSSCEDIAMTPKRTTKYHLQIKNDGKDFTFRQKLDQWTHTCMTWESKTGELVLYINGSKIKTMRDIMNDKIIFGNGEVLLGLERDPSGSLNEKCDSYTVTQTFKGEITYLYMWNKVSTQDEIGNATMFRQICDNLILDWKCFIQKSKRTGDVRLERLDTNGFVTPA